MFIFVLMCLFSNFAGLYGTLFSKESDAAFSNYRMWESLGFIIAFAYSTFLCTSVKLYVLISVLVVGMTGYCIVECIIRKSNKDVKTKSDQMKRKM